MLAAVASRKAADQSDANNCFSMTSLSANDVTHCPIITPQVVQEALVADVQILWLQAEFSLGLMLAFNILRHHCCMCIVSIAQAVHSLCEQLSYCTS